MKESDILHENGRYWVLKVRGAYHVMRAGVTHSETESAYQHFDLARARCDYLAGRENPANMA